jgi:hypothetical protein
MRQQNALQYCQVTDGVAHHRRCGPYLESWWIRARASNRDRGGKRRQKWEKGAEREVCGSNIIEYVPVVGRIRK